MDGIEFDYKGYVGLANLQSGDVIDVASDLMSIMSYCRKRKMDFDANKLIDALKEAVGKDGTVLIRSFSWDFCKGIEFDVKTSPSRVGSLGTIALGRRDFKRTAHPLYSWVVSGKYEKELLEYNNVNGLDDKSIFSFLYEKAAKQVNIGNMANSSLTILHYSEIMAKVPYRKEKFFEADYITLDGIREKRKYSMHVRPFNVAVSAAPLDSEQTQKVLSESGLKAVAMFDDKLKLVTYDLRATSDFMIRDLTENEGKLFVAINGKNGFCTDGVDYSTAVF